MRFSSLSVLVVAAASSLPALASGCALDTFGAILDSPNRVDVRVITKTIEAAPSCVYAPVASGAFGGGGVIVEGTQVEYAAGSAPIELDVVGFNAQTQYAQETNWCGNGFGAANAGKCGGGGTPCPNFDADCPSGETCFAFAACDAAPTPNSNFCGVDYASAEANKCGGGGSPCPNGLQGECPSGQSCFTTFACPAVAELQATADASTLSFVSSPAGDFGDLSVVDGALQPGLYNSFYLHAEGTALGDALATGSVRFPGQEIVGIIFDPASLGLSDALFADPSAAYPPPGPDRGWEVASDFQDVFTLSESCDTAVAGLTCLAPADCEAGTNLGITAEGGATHPTPYPQIIPGSMLPGPNGRDNSVVFLVGGDYISANAAEVEGRMVVLGNMEIAPTGANSLVFAGVGSGIVPQDGADFIQVGGDIVNNRDSVAVMALASGGGKITYGGTLSGTGSFALGPQGSLVSDPALDLSAYADILADVNTKADYWATLPPNGAYTGINGGNLATFEAGPDGAAIQVFSIDASELSPPYGINVRLGASLVDKTVLINVNAPPGGVVNVENLVFIDGNGNSNYDIPSSLIQNVIWNFHDATTLNLGSCASTNINCPNHGEFIGSIIAPKATDVLMKLPGMSGRFITSGSVTHDWVGSQFHNYPFAPPTPLPNPPGFPDQCEEECPSGVELVAQIGSVEWPANVPITIDSADGDSVTFTVTNTWSTTTIQNLYTSFDEPAEADVCYLEQSVTNTDSHTYVAKCTSHTKLAIVDLFLEDSDLVAMSDATVGVPVCCHDPEVTPQPAIQYVVKLHCEPLPCPSDEEGNGDTQQGRFLRG